jgi:4-amino-4-deoxy-L-arabinose transferase-like glycosyltransferase
LHVIESWAAGQRGRQRLALALLFLFALALLSLGIGEHTSVTGKDEYYLSLRTPMCMMEQDQWIVPCLDGAPRLKKPPMLYWLTRLSYEAFGISLHSARLIAVSLASLLVLAVALIAGELRQSLGAGLAAGLLCLSFLSLFTGGRMLELDVPVAAFSSLAFYGLLRWYRRDQAGGLIFAACMLAAAFLTKGPIAFIVCGAGGLALLASEPPARRFVLARWRALLAALVLFMALALPWFFYVGQLYPEQSTQALGKELAARHFFQPSAVPAYGILLLALPWSFVALARLGDWRSLRPEARQSLLMLGLWLALTLLPFFLLKSFERYLYGSLVPLALLLSDSRLPWRAALRWPARLGLLFSLGAALLILALALWLHGAEAALLLGIPALAWFAVVWWRAAQPLSMSLSAALAWACVVGLAYPRLGINQIPSHIVELSRERLVAFYDGPQPGLLPAVLGRSLAHATDSWRLPPAFRTPCARFLVFVRAEQAADATRSLRQHGFEATQREQFGVLSARVSWPRMMRQGSTTSDLWQALSARDLSPLKPQVNLLEAVASDCAAL